MIIFLLKRNLSRKCVDQVPWLFMLRCCLLNSNQILGPNGQWSLGAVSVPDYSDVNVLNMEEKHRILVNPQCAVKLKMSMRKVMEVEGQASQIPFTKG